MTNETMMRVFEEIRELGHCQTGSDFSRDWLGKDDSYFRSLRTTTREASADAYAYLAGRLRLYGDCFSVSAISSISDAGQRMQELSRLCVDELLANGKNAISKKAATTGA